MRILCSGASGFIGSALCPQLEQDGHIVYRMLRYIAGGRYDSYANQDKIIFADLRDDIGVDYAVDKVRPDIIIHLGAMSQVAYSFTHPSEVNDVIHRGTIRMAEAAKRYGVKAFIHASTSEVYSKPGYKYKYPLTEEQPIGGGSPYSAAKVAAEGYLEMMKLSGFPAIIIRPFNSFGRFNVLNRYYVMERAITGAIENSIINLHDPTPYRDFLFREDHVRVYRTIVVNWERCINNTYNVCTGKVWSIEDMALTVKRVVAKLTGKDIKIEFLHKPDRPSDIERLHGSYERIKKHLGWVPRYSFEEGVEQAAIEWLKVLKKWSIF